ncbi:hypothetical protein PTI98_011693 [Pleurotus ostreatus]|nr:hypothetical protein PTI98_011693 [Pleurotus ostreatus]
MFLGSLKTKSWRDPKSSPMLGLEDAFISPLIERLETHRPHFDGLDDSMKSELRQIFLADSQPPALQVKAPELKDRMNGRQDSRPRSTPPIPPT